MDDLTTTDTTPVPDVPAPDDTPATPQPVTVSITYADGITTADLDGAAVHLDRIDLTKALHRERYIKAVAGKVPHLDVEDAERQLMDIARQLNQKSAEPEVSAPADELDALTVSRPELFHHVDVSGITVPATVLVDNKPGATWKLYLRWADGKRECRPLASSIDLPEARRMFLHPTPGEPSMSTAAGWTPRARREWLEGTDAPDAAVLFRDVCEAIAHYIDFAPETAVGTTATLALWIVLTYCYPQFAAVPYLSIGGPMGSGKTRILDILARLSFRPLSSSNLTGAALFRTLHDLGGTLFYDEAERLRQSTPDVSELNSMLLAGYRRGGTATRLEAVGDSFRTVHFDVYGPKAIAGIAGLPPALQSRTILVMMFRAGPDSLKPRRRLDECPARWQSLRDGLHALALDAGPEWLDLPTRADVVPDAISGRDFELWQPLLALAAWIESRGATGLLSMMQRHALLTVAGSKDDAVPEADEVLLELLAEAVRGGDRPTPADLLRSAQERDEATFKKWGPRGVSNRLAVYGFKADKMHGRREYRATQAALAKVQAAYGIDLGIPTSTLRPPATPAPRKLDAGDEGDEGGRSPEVGRGDL